MYRGDKLALDIKTLRVVDQILTENPELKNILESSETSLEARHKLREWVIVYLDKNPHTKNYYLKKTKGHSALKKISFRDYAAIRLMDYLDYEGRHFIDPNRNNKEIVSSPIRHLWLAATQGKGSANKDFFLDMLYLFRQISKKLARRTVKSEQLNEWMERHPSGLDDEMIRMRTANKERIIRKIIEKIDSGEMTSKRFSFPDGLTQEEKYGLAKEWWNDYRFHLVFAIRTPEMLNEMLDYSLREKHLKILKRAKKKESQFSLIHITCHSLVLK
jgi:lysine 2,3-aminomutase